MIQQKYLFVLFENRLKEKVKHKNRTAALQAEKWCFSRLRRQLGMIQQERQNNIINMLGGDSYAM